MRDKLNMEFQYVSVQREERNNFYCQWNVIKTKISKNQTNRQKQFFFKYASFLFWKDLQLIKCELLRLSVTLENKKKRKEIYSG